MNYPITHPLPSKISSKYKIKIEKLPSNSEDQDSDEDIELDASLSEKNEQIFTPLFTASLNNTYICFLCHSASIKAHLRWLHLMEHHQGRFIHALKTLFSKPGDPTPKLVDLVNLRIPRSFVSDQFLSTSISGDTLVCTLCMATLTKVADGDISVMRKHMIAKHLVLFLDIACVKMGDNRADISMSFRKTWKSRYPQIQIQRRIPSLQSSPPLAPIELFDKSRGPSRYPRTISRKDFGDKLAEDSFSDETVVYKKKRVLEHNSELSSSEYLEKLWKDQCLENKKSFDEEITEMSTRIYRKKLKLDKLGKGLEKRIDRRREELNREMELTSRIMSVPSATILNKRLNNLLSEVESISKDAPKSLMMRIHQSISNMDKSNESDESESAANQNGATTFRKNRLKRTSSKKTYDSEVNIDDS